MRFSDLSGMWLDEVKLTATQRTTALFNPTPNQSVVRGRDPGPVCAGS